MAKTLSFYKTSDGSATTTLAVECVGEWLSTVVGQPYSFEADCEAGATGTWSLEGSNADPATVNTDGSPISANCYWMPPTQPAGDAGVTSIVVLATHEKMRPRYVPTSGGTATTFVGRAARGASTVTVMTPDLTITPFSNASALAALVNGRTVNGHPLTADVTVTKGDVSLDNVTNDTQTKAAVVPNTAPTAGQLLVGNAGGTAYAPVAMSGGATLANTGVITLALATPSAPGAMSAAQNNRVETLDAISTGTIPAFVANAATIAPGTDRASRYALTSGVTLAAASALTLSTAGTPCVGNKLIMVYALALGYTLSIVNGGPAAGTLATFGATLSGPKGVIVYWDGTNYVLAGYIEGSV